MLVYNTLLSSFINKYRLLEYRSYSEVCQLNNFAISFILDNGIRKKLDHSSE